uniref:Calmodulin binding transcription activator 1 n=2 Tax=Metatheria TaxID=9263 RepID=F6U1D3_MONDO
MGWEDRPLLPESSEAPGAGRLAAATMTGGPARQRERCVGCGAGPGRVRGGGGVAGPAAAVRGARSGSRSRGGGGGCGARRGNGCRKQAGRGSGAGPRLPPRTPGACAPPKSFLRGEPDTFLAGRVDAPALHHPLGEDMPRMPSSELLIKLLKRTVSKTESPELATKDPPSDDHGNSNGSHVKIFLPKKLLECLPKCSSLPKERHRWNTNERS